MEMAMSMTCVGLRRPLLTVFHPLRPGTRGIARTVLQFYIHDIRINESYLLGNDVSIVFSS